jgi:hypothetical protein
MVRAEQEAIAEQRHLLSMIGEENPMRVEVEEKMRMDQHHLDELWQMLPTEFHNGEADASMEGVAPEAAAAVEPPAAPAGPVAGAEPKVAADKATPTDAELKETGRQRAVTQLAGEAHREKGRRGERAGETVGRAAGALGGAAAGRRLIGGRAGTIAGLAAGYAAGGKAGKELGAERDIRKNASVKEAVTQLAGEGSTYGKNASVLAGMAYPAAVGMRFKFASMKLGFGPDLGTYMMAEQAGQEAQGKAEADFYREKLRTTEEMSGATQQQLADMQAQLEQLQAEKEQVGATIQSASQEATMARDDALAQTQAAANMRIGYQKLRQTIIDAASQDPEAMAGGLPGDLPPGSGNGIAPAMQPGMPGASPEAVAPGQAPAEAGGPGAPGGAQNAAGPPPGPGPAAQPSSALKTAGLRGEIGAIGGGVIGGAMGAYHGLKPGMELEQRQQAAATALGRQDGSMARTMDTAKAVTSVVEAEQSRAHPIRAALGGGLRGALQGGAIGHLTQRLGGNIGRSFQ